MSKLVLQTAAAVEPISLTEAKTHLRITGTEDDTYIARLITAATSTVQNRYWTQICTATFDEYFDAWPASQFSLRKSPTLTVTSVKYTDTAGVSQTAATTVWEQADENSQGIVRLKYDQTWPSGLRGQADDIVIRYTAGYGDASATPEPIKQALLMVVADMYAFRESVSTYRLHINQYDTIAQTIDALMSGYSYASVR